MYFYTKTDKMMNDRPEGLAEAIETAILFLSKKSSWKWVLETEDVPNTIESLTKKLKDSLPEMSVSILDISKYIDPTSIRSALNNAALGNGNRLLIIKGLEDMKETDLNIGLGDFLNSLGDDYNPNFTYTYEKEGLSIVIILRRGTQNHFIRYYLTQKGKCGLLH